MPTPAKYKAPFHPLGYYHLVFKSVDGIKLFNAKENHDFFLQKFSHYFYSFCSCLAYCLLDNHAHFIIHVNSLSALNNSFLATPFEKRTVFMKKFLENPVREELIDEIMERQANRFMTSYANAYNIRFLRKGNLFQSPFRRVKIKEDAHLQQAIIYVHANAQKHEMVKDFKDYSYSSYWEVINDNSANTQVEEVLQIFEGKDQYIKLHQAQVEHYYKNDWPSSKLE